MDVASPLLEYVNSGRMMSTDEISEIIQVVRSAEKYKSAADRLATALGAISIAPDMINYEQITAYGALWRCVDIARAALKEQANVHSRI